MSRIHLAALNPGISLVPQYIYGEGLAFVLIIDLTEETPAGAEPAAEDKVIMLTPGTRHLLVWPDSQPLAGDELLQAVGAAVAGSPIPAPRRVS